MKGVLLSSNLSLFYGSREKISRMSSRQRGIFTGVGQFSDFLLALGRKSPDPALEYNRLIAHCGIVCS